MTEDHTPPSDEAIAQCLRTLRELSQAPGLADTHPGAYAVFQAAQKYYKSVKKARKYEKKASQAPSPNAPAERHSATLEADPAHVRFRFKAPGEAQAPIDTAPLEGGPRSAEAETSGADRARPEADVHAKESCYICGQPRQNAHPTYPSMCQPCGTFNLSKREQTAPLDGRTFVVTGARVKIGYQVGLRLLRNGASVIATTRFPHDAAKRYAAEPDANTWQERLHIYGLDLRYGPGIAAFVDDLAHQCHHIDGLIQNAAQTVHRPPLYYKHLLAHESCPGDSLPQTQRQLLMPSVSKQLVASTASQTWLPSPLRAEAAGDRLSSAALSQVSWWQTQRGEEAFFPEGALDEDQQQIDNRPHNSWVMKLDEVPPGELWEVHMVNAIAPFLLLQQLVPMLKRSPSEAKFVIHAAAVEGQFQVTGRKPARHPHTNMSKAALNMLTRTVASDLARDQIYVNSVDPGWVSMELPRPYVGQFAASGHTLPIDAIDGAARICDPIFEGVLHRDHSFGRLYKDFRPSPW